MIPSLKLEQNQCDYLLEHSNPFLYKAKERQSLHKGELLRLHLIQEIGEVLKEKKRNNFRNNNNNESSYKSAQKIPIPIM